MSERVSFASATGPTLAGIVDIPPGDVRKWGVFSHGLPEPIRRSAKPS